MMHGTINIKLTAYTYVAASVGYFTEYIMMHGTINIKLNSNIYIYQRGC